MVLKNISNKCQIIIFVIAVFLLSSICYWHFIFAGDVDLDGDYWVFAIMWIPGTVGVICSLIFDGNLKSIAFRLFTMKQLAIAYGFPVIASILVFILLLITGIDQFGITPELLKEQGGVSGVLVTFLLITPIFWVLRGMCYTLGEEMGWRGFLHSRFQKSGIPHPYIITGVIWSLWHFPVILFSNYATSEMPYLSALIFMVMVVSISVFLGWQRERSGSVWLGVVTHAAHNIWMQSVYPVFLITGSLDQYFGGESGIFLAGLYVVAAIYIYRTQFTSKGYLR